MQTRGEYLVGSTFNPSNDDMVAKLKAKAAEFIDLVDTIAIPTPDDQIGTVEARERASNIARLKALAVTAAEEAAMWAVKAATKPERR